MAVAAKDPPCQLLMSPESVADFSAGGTMDTKSAAVPDLAKDIKRALASKDVATQIRAVRMAISLEVNGGNVYYKDGVHRFAHPVLEVLALTKDNSLKKLCLYFIETVYKRNPITGGFLQEMLLAVEELKKQMRSPNEYTRGTTLRVLTRIKEEEMLPDSLIHVVLECLSDRYPYVRKNAVNAVHAIYKDFRHLIPDAPERILKLLEAETDATTKRNCFVMLYNTAQDSAVQYLTSVLDEILTLPDTLQLACVELVRTVARSMPEKRATYGRALNALLTSRSAAVRFEAAAAVLTIFRSVGAAKLCAQTYIELLVGQADNNVKLVVLSRLAAMQTDHEDVLRGLLMDILRALASPATEIRRRTLELAASLITSRNVAEVVQILKKEVARSRRGTASAGAAEKAEMNEYREALIGTIRACAVKYPAVAPEVIDVLLDLLTDASASVAREVMSFARELAGREPSLLRVVLERLRFALPGARSPVVSRGILWVLGEFSTAPHDIEEGLRVLREELGAVPFVTREEAAAAAAAAGGDDAAAGDAAAAAAAAPRVSAGPVVNKDGTYATQTAESILAKEAAAAEAAAAYGAALSGPSLRAMLLGETGKGAAGDASPNYFLGAALATCLTKLTLRSHALVTDARKRNQLTADTMLRIASLLRVGRVGVPASKGGVTGERVTIDEDTAARLLLCLRVLGSPSAAARDAFLAAPGASFRKMLDATSPLADTSGAAERVAADAKLSIRQLTDRVPGGGSGKSASVEDTSTDLAAATSGAAAGAGSSAAARLDHLIPLTGINDRVYAECYVLPSRHYITLEVVVVNQTSDRLRDLSLELFANKATGDDDDDGDSLRVVEVPPPVDVPPHGVVELRAQIKVSSSDGGVIFGNLCYDVDGKHAEWADANLVILREIHVDILDYIEPALISEADFRERWQDANFENLHEDFLVPAPPGGAVEFLADLCRKYHMHCLTPLDALDADAGFLAANLYAKCIFGEEVFINVCVEVVDSGAITGKILIRTEKKGIAVIIGEKLEADYKKASA